MLKLQTFTDILFVSYTVFSLNNYKYICYCYLNGLFHNDTVADIREQQLPT
jgi:hypothetical protein